MKFQRLKESHENNVSLEKRNDTIKNKMGRRETDAIHKTEGCPGVGPVSFPVACE